MGEAGNETGVGGSSSQESEEAVEGGKHLDGLMLREDCLLFSELFQVNGV